MKAVLITIQPKWCELIASGKKTVEVRKTKPKIDVPFKCYIYCAKNTRKYALHTYINSGYGRKNFGVIGQWRNGKEIVDVNPHLPAYRYNAYLAEGKVIGEFVCDKVYDIKPHFDKPDFCNQYLCDWNWGEGTACLSFTEINDYLNGKNGYGWRISNLVIYDKPMLLSEFYLACNKPSGTDCSVCIDRRENRCKSITRPPQSWCYVEGGE